MTNAACFACLTPGEWQIIELQMLCEILASLGGGSSGSVTFLYTGNGLPEVTTPAPTQSVALYIDKDTGQLWHWYDSAWH